MCLFRQNGIIPYRKSIHKKKEVSHVQEKLDPERAALRQTRTHCLGTTRRTADQRLPGNRRTGATVPCRVRLWYLVSGEQRRPAANPGFQGDRWATPRVA